MWLILVIIFLLVIIFTGSEYKNNVNTENDNIKSIDIKLEKIGFITSKYIVPEYNCLSIFGNSNEVRIDYQNRKIAICVILPIEKIYILKFDEIIECSIIEDSNTIMQGGVGRAIAGGVIAGGVGAIVGANTRASKNVMNNLSVRIVTSNPDYPMIMLNMINNKEINKNNEIYLKIMKYANSVYSALISVSYDKNDTDKNNENVDNLTLQLEKLSKLKNDHYITEEEFEIAKRKLFKN